MPDILQVRNVLETPVPKVLAWSSKAQDNPVGVECIIMEKAPGIELERVWPSMNIKDRLAVVKVTATYQSAWASISFKKFGSLYYKNDLSKPLENEPLYVDMNGIDVTDRKFAVGPSTSREMTDNNRATVRFDRGPCKITTLRCCSRD